MQLRGKAHKVAKSEIENWALETSTELLRKELVQYATTTKAPEAESEVVGEDSLKEMTFDALSQQIELHSPRLHNFLSEICLATRRGRTRQRNSNFVSQVPECLYIATLRECINSASQYS
jgi:hypothetical protein